MSWSDNGPPAATKPAAVVVTTSADNRAFANSRYADVFDFLSLDRTVVVVGGGAVSVASFLSSSDFVEEKTEEDDPATVLGGLPVEFVVVVEVVRRNPPLL